eukprot:gb/GEZN01018295.1/.p1 GENE.gb/GEZN01018295.1/~~gb/GEZN01018295.1/.p1  ORF type:complete len:219 (+),score=19.69 gb/GEZN01018295.1/:34-657(+)
MDDPPLLPKEETSKPCLRVYSFLVFCFFGFTSTVLILSLRQGLKDGYPNAFVPLAASIMLSSVVIGVFLWRSQEASDNLSIRQFRTLKLLFALQVLALLLQSSSALGIMYGKGKATEATIDVVAAYSVGGAVSGVPSGSYLVLLNNGQDPVSLSDKDSSFTFPNKISAGASYHVTIQEKPDRTTCEVTGGQGTVRSANVDSIVVNCA